VVTSWQLGADSHYRGKVIDKPLTAPRILIVDDDPTVAEVVARYLARDGHRVECVADGREALRRALDEPPDLIVLDLMLPGMSGLEVCRRIRATSPVPVVMLTALGEETDRLVGLEIGADDYVTKPFSPRELALRVKAVLRRARGDRLAPDAGVLTDGDLTVDVGAHEVTLAGAPLALSHQRQAFTREELLDKVWGWSFGDSSTVTVHVRRLREKIEPDPTTPQRIRTVWGVGYRYEGATP
jgi:DNA-binding response OmpR family regulator